LLDQAQRLLNDLANRTAERKTDTEAR
jgi:hypothetical protein